MNRIIISLLLASSASAYAGDDPVLFVKQLPYKQVVKDVVLSRCLAQVADDKSQFSVDAARSSNALLEWVPFDIETVMTKLTPLLLNTKVPPMAFIPKDNPQFRASL